MTTKQGKEAAKAKPARTAKPGKAVIEVASAIIQRDGRYLVSQRPEGSHLGPCWEFPGGKRLPAETIEECAQRKVREELGIEISVDKLWRVIERSYPERVVRLHFFLCTLESGTPRAIGCQHFRWIQPSEFGNYEFPPADLDIVHELARRSLRLAAAAAAV